MFCSIFLHLTIHKVISCRPFQSHGFYKIPNPIAWQIFTLCTRRMYFAEKICNALVTHYLDLVMLNQSSKATFSFPLFLWLTSERVTSVSNWTFGYVLCKMKDFIMIAWKTNILSEITDISLSSNSVMVKLYRTC